MSWRTGTTLITGGAGFVGTNLAHRIASDGGRVIVFDNLSRAGVEDNLRWLVREHERRVQVEIADIRDAAALRRAVTGADRVVHLAAQVAVTTSLTDPLADFAINAGGTLTLLELLRGMDAPPPLIFTSTNKVYGAIADLAVTLDESRLRYQPAAGSRWTHGISEAAALDFHSPYGCSKGVADQYVLDYARSYGLPTTVFRMSCIYGTHQCGTEDQGWVAHFVKSALRGQPITLYGDGRQVRDILFVDDLVTAFRLAFDHMDTISGQAFNLGGGPARTVSLLELLQALTALGLKLPPVLFNQWRSGDQKYYVSDTDKFTAATGWQPRVSVRDGLRQLTDWLYLSTPSVPARRVPAAAAIAEQGAAP